MGKLRTAVGVGELENVLRGGQQDQTNYELYKQLFFYNFRAKFTLTIYEWTGITFTLTLEANLSFKSQTFIS